MHIHYLPNTNSLIFVAGFQNYNGTLTLADFLNQDFNGGLTGSHPFESNEELLISGEALSSGR